MSSLSDAITHFGLDLFQELRKAKEDNISFSPVNIVSGLSMLLLGARENTALEIVKVLHLNRVMENANVRATKEQEILECNQLISGTRPATKDFGQSFIHGPNTQSNQQTFTDHNSVQGAGFRVEGSQSWKRASTISKLLTELKKPTDAYELNLANRLYGEKTFQFLQDYLNNNKKCYLANAESTDFVNATEESRRRLIPRWKAKQMDASKPLQMMKQRATFHLAFLEEVQAKVVEIPYKGKDLSMFVLLPNEVDGLQKLEDKLTTERFKEWVSSPNMRERHVDLYLPKFQVEESYDLRATLEHMGMADPFQDADFSGGSRDLAVSKILHKSFVEVMEEGTEAVAATSTEMVPMLLPVNVKFQVDHPFKFTIRHHKTNTSFFFGRVSSP